MIRDRSIARRPFLIADALAETPTRRRRTAGFTASVLLASAAVVFVDVGTADGQNRVDQRRNSSAERVQPNRPGLPPGSPRTGGGPRFVDQGASQFRGGVNPIAPDESAEFRRRNAMITGNAPGGRSFRGVVGYSSPFDFREEAGDLAFGANALGSDDLFEFQAGSLFSDPRLVQAAPSIRYGLALGQLEVFRNSRGTAAGDLRAGELTERRLDDLDRTAGGLQDRFSDLRRLVDASALDSGLDRFVSQTGGPTPVGLVQLRGTRRRLDASPLAGLQPALADADLNQFGVPTSRLESLGPQQNAYLVSGNLTPMDRARLIEDARDGRLSGVVGETFRDSFVETRVDPAARREGSEDARVERSVLSPRVGAIDPDADAAADVPDWQRIRDEIARRYSSEARGRGESGGSPSEGELRELETDLDRLRRGLGAAPGTPATPDPSGGAGSGRGRPGATSGGLAPDRGGEDEDDGDGDGERPDGTVDRDRVGRVDLSRLARSLRHGQRIDALVDAQDRSRAGELIGDGEKELRRGDYFRAERTFTRALRLVPGHPTATVGLAHARLGAGLHIPAALVIRDLFTYQPEMIGATYADGLVPNRPRLLRALETLRGRVSDNRDATDTGLLLAYVGRLLERPDVVQEGLRVMREADADDPLVRLLETVWVVGPLDESAGG